MSGLTFGVVIPPYGPFQDPEELWSVVAAAEELGFASVWFGDHIVVPPYAAALTPPDWFDAVALCLVGLGRTTTLRFGTDVLVAPYRRPVEFAHLAASADKLGGGRLTLGMGVGFLEGEFEALQTPYAERGAVTDEYLKVLRLLWESEGQPVSYSGRWVSFSNVLFGPAPAQKPLPLLVGGNGDRALRRAALLGDGWHPLFCSPEQYQAGRERIRQLLTENGRGRRLLSASPTRARPPSWSRRTPKARRAQTRPTAVRRSCPRTTTTCPRCRWTARDARVSSARLNRSPGTSMTSQRPESSTSRFVSASGRPTTRPRS